MKKIIFTAAIAFLMFGILTVSFSCSDDDDDETTENTEGTGNNTEGTGNTDGTENTANTATIEAAKKSGWTDDELSQANTAANIASLSQMEKDIILYCNLARLDGAKFWETYGKANAKGSSQYVSSLESDLSSIKNRKMLIPETSLLKAAAAHAKDMSDNNFFDHTSSDGTSFADRVRSFYKGSAMAENISAGMNTALGVVMQLLVDDGLESLGHRKNILNESLSAIGVKTATHKTYKTITVQDFGDKVIDKAE